MLSLMRPPYPFLLFPFSESPLLGLQVPSCGTDLRPPALSLPTGPQLCLSPGSCAGAANPLFCKAFLLLQAHGKGMHLPTPQERGADFAGGETEAKKREGNTCSCLPACPRIALLLLSRSRKWARFPPASPFCLLNRKASLWSPGLLSLLPQVTIALSGDCCRLLRTP